MEALSRKLGLILAKLNLSRARLAQKIGVDKSVVSRWASGSSVPSDHNMARLSEIIGALHPGPASPPASAPTTSPHPTPR